jgi:hypothetical protein
LFKGIIVAQVIPFTSNGELNTETVKESSKFHLEMNGKQNQIFIDKNIIVS